MDTWRRVAALFVVIAAALQLSRSESKLRSYQNQYQENNIREFVKSEDKGLYPEIYNLATKSIITANATCGSDGPESYCKLVEHVFMRMPQCDICNVNSVEKSHPIEFAIDGTNRWWQSPSLSKGLQYEWVTITLDLRQQYQVAYVIVKSAIAPRPGTWVLERSLDGVDYKPWQYFVTEDLECMRSFGVPATSGVPRFKTDDEVICTSFFSKLEPLENGEVHTSLVNGRPGIEGPSVALQNFTRARYVRLRMQKLRTLNADLMIISRRHNTTSRIDQSVTRRYFYALKDISIGGQCICYGHAESCPSDPVTGQLRCECRHNTCGESCDRCCPLFNQLPWRQGTNTENNICQACQCHSHATECVYDPEIERLGLSVTPEGIFEGGGKCVECMHNTEGVNCEKCKSLYFRPSGVSHYREDACRPCDCDLLGSVDGNCIRDDTSAVNELRPGDCVCKPGFGGRRCDRCAAGYRNHPTCEPCPCNQAGSVNFDTCEEDSCMCKANVEGVHCDRCKPGTINLDVMNPEGCQPCFCFGITDQCAEYPWGKGEVRQMLGWKLTDGYSHHQRMVDPNQESGDFLIFNVNDTEHRSLSYWRAPKEFTGNLLKTYAGTLQYYVYFVPGNTGDLMGQADIVIEGNGIKIEHYSQQQFFGRENISMHVKMHESDRWYNSQTRQPVDKREFMRALADVKLFLVRAMYHQNQVQSSIYGLSLEVATDDSNSEHKMKSVEKCTCPDTFDGNSCESCIAGYRRVNDQLFKGTCEKCECQDHSQTCDPFTGHCLECQHNTTGRRCENCLPGHYGNPSLGGQLGSCRPCGCPLTNPDNNFSATCSMASLVSGGATSVSDDYVCTACEPGYQGNKCEMCADGYFGDPMAVNGSCQVCDCNGNVDAMAIGNCDSITGHCLKCIGYTTGDHCELCKENHYGSALRHSCHPCSCHVRGSVAANCDNDTGACTCNEFYQGLQCSQCTDGHGDIENGCPACACNVTGSTHATHCDEVSGQCSCKPGVFGKHCDSCRTGYFNFTDRGCQFCQCSADGSVDDGSCNNVTGQCICRKHVGGTSCSECEKGFFNITSGEGCQACECDAQGAEDGGECDMRSGQCRCRPGVTGVKCDKCAPNHYGLDDTGCKQCQKCPAPGHVCDSDTGDCVCPPNTVGEMCENCTDHSWNYDPLKGCEECNCNSEGAIGVSCDLYSGQCTCRDEFFVGLKCDMCIHGHFNFPNCKECRCNLAGTEMSACNADGVCSCDEKGQCPCKKSVQGLKCDKCTAQSFSLEKANPAGCTDCFCFNHTNFCVQSSYVWQQILAHSRRTVFEQSWDYCTEKHGLCILKEHPANFKSNPPGRTPLYWPLPRHLLGDRTASYNGFIRFKIANDDNRQRISSVRPDEQYFRYYPMVVLVGNDRIVLEHIPENIADNGKYRVRLREDLWRSRSSPDIPVSRKQLMVALQRLQAVYVRGTYNYHSEHDVASISEISLDVAVWDNTTDVANSDSAIGVETCGDCPQGFSGMSCQNPAEGYCRKRKTNYLDSEDDLELIGWSSPCACHGHSTTCDAETCRCTNCEHNTFGDSCDYCMPGFHGDARGGHSTDCKKCACPLIDNNFSDTCRPVPDGRGYVCDACKAGYTGMYCESCIDGYFGNPNIPGGSCSQCDCHADGSLNDRCDIVTGQCQCRPGVTGRTCSDCQPRHMFMGGQCTSCDQGCTKDLMVMQDELEAERSRHDFTDLTLIPWKHLYKVGNSTVDLRAFLANIKIEETGAAELIKEVGGQNYVAKAMGVVNQANFVLECINKSHSTINELIAQANDVDGLSNDIYRKATDLVNQLKYFTSFGDRKRSSSEVGTWLVEAEEHLNQTKVRDVYIDKHYNRVTVEFEKAKELLKKLMSRKLNDTTFEILLNQLNKFNESVKYYEGTLCKNGRLGRADIKSTRKINQVSKKSLHQYKQVFGQITDLEAEAKDGLTEGENSVAGAENAMLLNMNYTQEMNENLFDAIEAAAEKCSMHADKSSQSIDEYRIKYVQQSQVHAETLKIDALHLQNSYLATKKAAEKAIAASKAYADIAGALKNATDTSNAAKKAADEAFDLTSSEWDDSMAEMAELSHNVSLELLSKARKLSVSGVSDLEEEREGYKMRLGNVNKDIIAGEEREDIRYIRDQYLAIDDKHEDLNRVSDAAQIAENRVSDIKTEVDKLAADINATSQRVNKLREVSGQGIREVTIEVREAAVEMTSAQNRLKGVQTQAINNDGVIETLGEDINILKEKIKEAREMASRVRIAVKSNGLCRRSYMSPASPSPVNVLSVKYKPAQDVTDSLIFVTNTKSRRTQPSEHMALELRQKRIVFHWNIGGGNRMITNTFPITYIPPSARNTWYHIDMKRKGDSAMLTVAKKQTLPGGEAKDVDEEPTAVEHAFQSNGDVIFNTQPGETLLSLGSEVDLSALGIETILFHGIVGELSVDEQTLPLWGFEKSNHDCLGAVSSATTSSSSSSGSALASSYMFRDGYAEVQTSFSERSSDSMITVVFAAYSPDGLIYFRGSQNNGDFISLELRNGAVVFKFNLGGESTATVRSKNSYNDGWTHTIRANRTKQEGELQVDGESDWVTSVAPGKNSALDVNDGNHFVGGVPASLDVSKWNRFDIHWRGFFGCISSVKPSQSNELDLNNPVRSQRKEPGCMMGEDRLHTSDRVIGFTHPGYFVVSGISMSNNSSLAFNFRTYEPNAILLFQSSRLATYHLPEASESSEGQGFLAFYLYQGSLVAHLGTDAAQRSKLVTLRTDARLSDGQLHAVFLSRDGKTVKLTVDDHPMASGKLSESALIGSSRAQMFIGGFPDKVKPLNSESPSSVPLIGCISDIYLNFKRVPLIPEAHNATIGVCDVVKPFAETQVTPPTKTPVEPDTPEPPPQPPSTTPPPPPPPPSPSCIPPPHRDSDSPGAARFGVSDASHTHVTFPYPKSSFPDFVSFTLSFSFRTKKPNGMLWVWANYKNYTRYFNLSLTDGHLMLTIKGHKEPMSMLYNQSRLDDNQWHMVKMIKIEKELRLQVDDFSMTEKRVPNPKVVRKRMFIGGILSPHKKLLKERTPGGWNFPGFDGCIADFMVNQKNYDLLDENYSRDVVPCTKPTNSSYVHEGGFLTFDAPEYQGDVLQLGVEFRSGQADGWIFALLSNKDASFTRVGLRLTAGKIVFQVLIDGVEKYLHEYSDEEATTCDGKWHHVSVTLDGDKDAFLSILDGERVSVKLEGALTRVDLRKLMRLPLHVGGLAPSVIDELGGDSLQGCFGRLQAGGADLALESARRVNKVLLNECFFKEKKDN